MKPEGDILEMKSEIDSMLLGFCKDWIESKAGSGRISINFLSLYFGMKDRLF